jgi:hypothetical protein
VGDFGRNDSNLQGFRLLKTFQSLGTMLVYLGFEVAPEKKNRTGSNLANAADTRCQHSRRKHAQGTFLWEFWADDEMRGRLHHLDETTHFLLYANRKYHSI